MAVKQYILIFMALAAFAACKKTPEGILSKGKMEEVLFDYHLVQGMIDQMNSEQRLENQRYLDAVFQKHGITEAEFDTSMVWYNRNGILLKEIYADLNKLYKDLDEELKLRSGNSNMLTTFSQTGDTANIWTGDQLILLRPQHLFNKEVFSLKADTTFCKKDKFKLYATAYFIKEVRDDRNCSLTVGIIAEYKNGKTTGATRTVDYNGAIDLTLETSEEEEIEALHGFFFYRGTETMRNLALINKIAILRMHDHSIPRTTPDSTKIDSASVDTVSLDSAPAVPRRHLTPEEVHKQNKTMERIEIKAMPEIRTRNSYGPKRKKKTKSKP